MSFVIRCENLRKTYPGRPPVDAVRGIDLSIQPGECFGVLGPNGAGKTTTIEILEGLLKPTAGLVEVLGLNWKRNADEIRQRIGVSLQETELSDKLTVLETLRLFRSFYRDGITAEDAMGQVSLQEKSNSWIKKLSGGQKQRLAVATALVGDPELLFLDEPTTGLDPTSRRELWDIIRGFKAQGRTVLLTTHYMEEAERLCDRVAIFDAGKVIATGTPDQLVGSLGAEHLVEFSVTDGQRELLDVAELNGLAGVNSVEFVDDQFQLNVSQPHIVLPELIQLLTRSEIGLADLSTRNASLEDVFVHLTGRHLDEEEVAA